jgi:hypothetical protein
MPCRECRPGVWECGSPGTQLCQADVLPWEELGEILVGGTTVKVYAFPPSARVRFVAEGAALTPE